VLFSYLFTAPLGKLADSRQSAQISQTWYDQWLLGKVVQETLSQLEFDHPTAAYGAGLVRLLIGQQDWPRVKGGVRRKPYVLMSAWLEDESIRRFLGVNSFDGVAWFNLESMQNWIWWVLAVGVLETMSTSGITKAEMPKRLTRLWDMLAPILAAIPESDYRVDRLLAALEPGKKI